MYLTAFVGEGEEQVVFFFLYAFMPPFEGIALVP